ncbi:Platelet-activating factor acetylhydrolase [Manis javanica]|nr:Platelet-activating factor acetylhydrolase [Manis javanica]
MQSSPVGQFQNTSASAGTCSSSHLHSNPSNSRQRRDAEFALDAWMFPVGDEVCSRIPQPFFISSEWFQYPANIIKMKKCYLPGRERKMIAIRRTEAVARRKHMPAEARVWVQRMGGSFPTEVVRRSCLEDTGTELDLQQRDGEERSGYFRGSVHQNFADFCHWQNHWIHIHIKRRNRFKDSTSAC